MRLKYRILWFEDETEFVEKITPQICEYLLEDLGLELEVNPQQNGNNLDNLVKQNDYDLIVTDLNLDDGQTGKNLIERIRADEVLTEVLLYSANGQEIQKVINETPGLERVSFAVGRDALPDRLRRIIALTVRKVQDVTNVRGLVIAEAIDLEDKMLEIITQYFMALKDNTEKDTFIKKHLEGKDEYFQKQMKEISSFSAPQILEFVDKACGEMFSKYVALNRLLDATRKKLNHSKPDEEVKIVLLDKLKDELKKMNDEVINLRNDLAHVKEEKDEHGQSILKNIKRGREIVFSNDTYIGIRKSLRYHAANLAEIAKHFQ